MKCASTLLLLPILIKTINMCQCFCNHLRNVTNCNHKRSKPIKFMAVTSSLASKNLYFAPNIGPNLMKEMEYIQRIFSWMPVSLEQRKKFKMCPTGCQDKNTNLPNWLSFQSYLYEWCICSSSSPTCHIWLSLDTNSSSSQASIIYCQQGHLHCYQG